MAAYSTAFPPPRCPEYLVCLYAGRAHPSSPSCEFLDRRITAYEWDELMGRGVRCCRGPSGVGPGDVRDVAAARLGLRLVLLRESPVSLANPDNRPVALLMAATPESAGDESEVDDDSDESDDDDNNSGGDSDGCVDGSDTAGAPSSTITMAWPERYLGHVTVGREDGHFGKVDAALVHDYLSEAATSSTTAAAAATTTTGLSLSDLASSWLTPWAFQDWAHRRVAAMSSSDQGDFLSPETDLIEFDMAEVHVLLPRVRLCGLTSACNLNGREGFLGDPKWRLGRYEVHLAHGKTVLAKPENLERMVYEADVDADADAKPLPVEPVPTRPRREDVDRTLLNQRRKKLQQQEEQKRQRHHHHQQQQQQLQPQQEQQNMAHTSNAGVSSIGNDERKHQVATTAASPDEEDAARRTAAWLEKQKAAEEVVVCNICYEDGALPRHGCAAGCHQSDFRICVDCDAALVAEYGGRCAFCGGTYHGYGDSDSATTAGPGAPAVASAVLIPADKFATRSELFAMLHLDPKGAKTLDAMGWGECASVEGYDKDQQRAWCTLVARCGWESATGARLSRLGEMRPKLRGLRAGQWYYMWHDRDWPLTMLENRAAALLLGRPMRGNVVLGRMATYKGGPAVRQDMTVMEITNLVWQLHLREEQRKQDGGDGCDAQRALASLDEASRTRRERLDQMLGGRSGDGAHK